MTSRTWIAVAALVAAACNSPDSLTPTSGPSVATTPAAGRSPTAGPTRHERLAKRLAKALRDPQFRAAVYREIRSSPNPEGKVHLQGFMEQNGGSERRRLTALSGDPASEVAADLDQGGAIEVYLPVPAHRRGWTGGENVLVATAATEADAPVAFDLDGRQQTLSRSVPPTTPVLAVNTAEMTFGPKPNALVCTFGCGGGTGGGGTGPTGIYLTQTAFNGTFEGWLKGDPEFEVHILGPTRPGSTTMTTLQCIGANAGGPYAWDQNAKTWTGSVLLFSQAQADQFAAQNPGQGFRVMVLEDDDASCQIKIDSSRVTNLVNALRVVYGNLTGAKDTTTSTLVKFVRQAPSLGTLVQAIASFFTTNDDLVGNAVGDSLVASTYFPRANWAVRGENSVVNGGIRLEVR